jgi:2-aminoadipate transaminase
MKSSEIRALFSVVSRPEGVSLAGGMPAVTALPLDVVGSMIGDLVSDMGAQTLQYGSGQGDPRLRERICDVMALEGIVDASPSEVVVTVGSQQGLDLVTRVFVDPGDVVLAEAPSYVGALGVFQAAQARVRHVQMDDEGLIPEALEEALTAARAAGDRVKFLYPVPNFHNPAGVTLSEPRREAIMAIAERYDLLIIEDNPYGLLGFEHGPMRALRARNEDRVIYLGSFSKTFSPGLRVGWVLAPLAVREKLVLATEAQVLCPPSLTQYAVARYLDTQPWREQIKVFTELYRERRDATLESLTALMPAGTTWTRPAGGFYVWLKLPHGLDAKLMQPRAVAAHVAYVPGIGFYADGSGREYMRLSYCYPEPAQIREGVRRLARVIEAELDLHSTFDSVDTGTFRAVPAVPPRTTASAAPDSVAELLTGPANSNENEDPRA